MPLVEIEHSGQIRGLQIPAAQLLWPLGISRFQKSCATLCHHVITSLPSTIASHQLCLNFTDWKNSAENCQLLEHPKSFLQHRAKGMVRLPLLLQQPATPSTRSGRTGRMSRHELWVFVLRGVWEGMGLFCLCTVTLQLMDTVAHSLPAFHYHIRKQHNKYLICATHPASIAWESYSVSEKIEMCITIVMASRMSYNSRQKQYSSFIQTRKTFRGKLARDTSRGP